MAEPSSAPHAPPGWWQVMRALKSGGGWRPLVVFMIFALGYGVSLAQTPSIITNGFHGDKNQAQAVLLWCNAGSSALTFLLAPWIGHVTDIYGRKWFLVGGFFLAWIPTLALAAAAWWPSISIWYYFAALVAKGLVDPLSITLAVLADVTEPHSRAASFGVLLALFSLGIAVAPAIGNMLSTKWATFTTVAVVGAQIVWIVCTFPETAPEAVDRRGAESRHEVTLNPFRSFGILNRNICFQSLAALVFFSSAVEMSTQDVLTFFLVEHRAFSRGEVTILFVMFGVMGVFIQGSGIQPMLNFLGDKRLLIFTMAAGIVSQLLYAFSTPETQWMCWVGNASSVFLLVSFPVISALKSNMATEREQGAVQGALSGCKGLAAAAGPLLLGLISKNVTVLNGGAMYVAGGGLLFVCVIIAALLPLDAFREEILRVKQAGTLEDPLLG